jgi:hypothetical protein
MESLEYFDPYTSYDLHWLPYEIVNCRKLRESRVSTRAFYGNFKNRMGFPSLVGNPVRYWGDSLTCSICKIPIKYEATNQLWITLRVGTDDLPLLMNLCSAACERKLPTPPEGYIQHPHKGGSGLQQGRLDPPSQNAQAFVPTNSSSPVGSNRTPKLFSVIWKIWERRD